VCEIDGARNAYKILDEKPLDKLALGKPKRRWEKTIKMHIRNTSQNFNIILTLPKRFRRRTWKSKRF
jgi:hypothetical protein